MRGCWRGAERAGERGAFAAAVNAQTALNLVSLLASRSAAAARRSSASFCAVEASVRVGPLDSLRTCERKRRRLNARGRPSFNCLPLVTGVEKAPAEAGGERGGGGRCARSPSRERFPHFLPCDPLPPPIASDGQFVAARVFRLAPSQPRIAPRANPPRSSAIFLFRKRGVVRRHV